ncbi:MAG TPA: hypothetical protein VNH18_16655, partial [Bryobacteraceae bacterium]|nr:hypothetical protein [Bryobacteraceae bacterium]
MKTFWLAVLALMPSATEAHRLDEYLQATLISVERDTVKLEVNLTPGVAILPAILERIDSDRDGVISEREERDYTEVVAADLTLSLDDHPLKLVLTDSRFDPWSEMREGRGVIRLRFEAELPHGNQTTHKLHFENRHQPLISAYLVNSLVPSDKFIHIQSQQRDYFQTNFRLAYSQSAGNTTGRGAYVAGSLI